MSSPSKCSVHAPYLLANVMTLSIPRPISCDLSDRSQVLSVDARHQIGRRSTGPVDRVYRVGTKRRVVHTAMWLDALLERLASTRWMGFSRHVATGCERLRDTGAIAAIEDVLELGVDATRTMR
jgi:hypothetical protein